MPIHLSQISTQITQTNNAEICFSIAKRISFYMEQFISEKVLQLLYISPHIVQLSTVQCPDHALLPRLIIPADRLVLTFRYASCKREEGVGYRQTLAVW